MANTLYKEINKKGKKKALIVVLCIAAALIVAVAVIGIIAGGMDGERETISAAVQENVQLKQLIDDLNVQLDEKQATIDALQAELAARPMITPEPAATPQAQQVSPRSNRE